MTYLAIQRSAGFVCIFLLMLHYDATCQYRIGLVHQAWRKWWRIISRPSPFHGSLVSLCSIPYFRSQKPHYENSTECFHTETLPETPFDSRQRPSPNHYLIMLYLDCYDMQAWIEFIENKFSRLI